MFVMDVPPDVPAQYAPIVVAEAAQARQQTMERTIGVCHLASSLPDDRSSAVNSMSPRLEASAYLQRVEGVKFDWKSTTWKMTLLDPPKHGTLAVEEGGLSIIHLSLTTKAMIKPPSSSKSAATKSK